MKRFVSVILLGTLCTYSAFSQQSIIATATGFIKQENYTRATRYLDSILRKQPKNVDALVMKGNVLLNYAWQHSSRQYFNRERAESVFDTASIDLSYYTPIIPLDTSEQIERIWKRCLLIDSSRNDIRKGLCNLYSLSLRVDELEKLLLQIRPLITQAGDNAFVYTEYARNLKARGRFDDAMKIYRLIADMFPNMAGIRCDMAGEYFYAGKPNDALRYLDSTLLQNVIDQTSYINAAAIYSSLGYYDNAFQTFKQYSAHDSLYMHLFYKGLMQFSVMDTLCYVQLQQFLKLADEKNYADEVALANRLVAFAQTEFTFDSYIALANDANIPIYYRVLIHQRGMKQFKDVCAPFLLYGYIQCTFKNYGVAAQFFDEVDNCKSQSAQNEFWRLAYAYTLYMSGSMDKAFPQFAMLINSADAVNQHAARYFAGKILLQMGKKDEATEYFKQVVTNGSQTKYAWLAKQEIK
jgi:tetratricopeptide (TPR) repeat protein